MSLKILLLLNILFVYLVSAVVVNSAHSLDFNDTISNNITMKEKPSVHYLGNDNASKLKIITSFYPIYEFVKRVGAGKVDVSTLIPIGIEPHDFEPSIQQVREAEAADIIFFNGAGLEDWIDRINAKLRVDVIKGKRLVSTNNTGEVKANYDPHIWLDPMLAQTEVRNIREALNNADAKNSQYYADNAKSFINDLEILDSEIRNNLSACNKKDFIAYHNSFTYFADRYGLIQHSIKGPSPEGEILPQRLVEVISLAKDLGLDIIYSEDLADPRSAETISQEIPDGRVLILSPIEGINKQEQKEGIGYLDKMRQNLKNLMEGLDCNAT
jgi:zinc transport system substrate-binding protein